MVSFHLPKHLLRKALATSIVLALALACIFFHGRAAEADQDVSADELEPEQDSGPVIGIDLGTTYSCVGIYKGDRVEIISNDQGNRITPSYVAFTEDGRLIGDPAKNQATLNPKNTIFDVKRLIGRELTDKHVVRDRKLVPFSIVGKGDKPYIEVEVQGEARSFAPEEVSAMVLGKIKEIAEAYLGETVPNAVVTVPAYFNDAQRRATRDAGRIAGLNVLRILDEPTAAALAYGFDKKGDKNILVFDLGGGTFDVSLLNVADGFFEVLATDGDTHLGGEDFDQRVMKNILKQFKKATDKDASQDPRALQKLRQQVELAKRTLSSATSAQIYLDSFFEGENLDVTLTRAQFERINMDLFRKTLAPVRKVLELSGMRKDEVDEILLVGGSTRIPKIQEMLSEFFGGKAPSRGINPDEAVAYGAAIQAGILAGVSEKVQDVVLIARTPLSLGIKTIGDAITPLIPRNTLMPITRSKNFTTTMDGQEIVDIEVYEGERPHVKDNHQLGRFRLEGLDPTMRRGEPQIEVTFSVDEDGILHVTAVDTVSGNEESITITNDDNRLNEEDILRMQQEAEEFGEQDREVRKTIEALNSVDAMLYDLQVTAEERDDLSEEDVDTILEAVDDVQQWMADNPEADYEEIDTMMEEIRERLEGILDIEDEYDDEDDLHDDL